MNLPRVIMLAAGQGTRLHSILGDTPKSLIPFGKESLLLRTLRQLNEVGFRDITIVVGHKAEDIVAAALSYLPSISIVHNPRYQSDRNILSLICGLGNSTAPALIIEADVAFAEFSALRLRESALSETSVWTTCGPFSSQQSGGIIKVDIQDNITEICYVDTYTPDYAFYLKNLGAMFVSAREMPLYHSLLTKQGAVSADCYFMTPWADNLARLPCKVLDLGKQGGSSFNTPEEYERALQLILSNDGETSPQIVFMSIDQLRHIEDFDQDRVNWLAEKIAREGVWTQPLCVATEMGLIMDGQHRYEAAKKLMLQKVPVVLFNYASVPIWSLRPETHEVSHSLLFDKIQAGSIYPYKTVKHQFPASITECNIPLSELKKRKNL